MVDKLNDNQNEIIRGASEVNVSDNKYDLRTKITNPGDISGGGSSVSSPTIYNITITTANTIQSQALPDGTTNIYIRQREKKAVVEFGFTASLATYVTIPKNSSYSDNGINTSGETLYFRSTKTGVLEILIWEI